jgi:hypothetical protein
MLPLHQVEPMHKAYFEQTTRPDFPIPRRQVSRGVPCSQKRKHRDFHLLQWPFTKGRSDRILSSHSYYRLFHMKLPHRRELPSSCRPHKVLRNRPTRTKVSKGQAEQQIPRSFDRFPWFPPYLFDITSDISSGPG